MDITNGTPNPKVVFLSSTSHTGNLGGVAGADAICQNLADVAGLTGTYKAWISDSTSQPLTSFTHFQVPYILVDGTIVADNWEDLMTSTAASPYLQNAIVRNEWGGLVVDNLMAWTATGTDGKLFIWDNVLDNCWNWTWETGLGPDSPFVLGWHGQADKMISAWTAALADGCNYLRRLYCFEQ